MVLEDIDEAYVSVPVATKDRKDQRSVAVSSSREKGISSDRSAVSCDPILSNLDKAATIDELCSRTGLSLVDIQNSLFDLQLEGKVEKNFAGMWEKSLS